MIIGNQYQILDKIGQGNMGEVFLAENIKNKKKYSIKRLLVENINSKSEAVIRFKKEAEIISSLSHPHIIKVYDLIEDNKNYCLIMEYFQGKNLNELKDKLTLVEKIEIIKKSALALEYIHSKSILHRDLKPSNILVYKKNGSIEVKIIDFGLAYLMNINKMFKDGEVVGSFAYMSPEQTGVLRRGLDNRSDLYSLGVSFFELLTGVLPFKDKNISKLIHQHLAKKPDLPSAIDKKLPLVIDEIVLKLLAKEPNERYQTADGLVKDLDFYLKNPKLKDFKIGKKDYRNRLNFQIEMVGRDEELNLLMQKFDKVKAKLPQIATILGPSGSGKSKLVETFREKFLIERNSFFISFKCSIESQNIPYAPLIDLFKDYFDKIYKDYYKEDILNEINKNLSILFTIFPFLEKYFKTKNDNEILNNENRLKIFRSILQLLHAIGRQKEKIVFFIDDIQWVDNGTLKLIEFLVENLVNCKLLIITTRREEGTDKEYFIKLKNKSKIFSLIELKLLTEKEIPLFISNILNTEYIFPPQFYHKIIEKTMGNSFFIIEMIQTMYNFKIIYSKENKWFLDEVKLNDFKFEKDLSNLVLKRVSNLSREEVEILSLASIIGKEFNVNLLKSLIDKEISLNQLKNEICLEQIINVIDNAEKKQLIKPDITKGKGKYLFVHDKIVEILQSRLKKHRKVFLHLICAKTLENIYRGNTEYYVYQIVFHYNFTNETEKKLFYNNLAYKKALLQYSIYEAVFYMQKIVDYHLENNKLNKDLIYLLLEMATFMQIMGEIEESLIYLKKVLNFVDKNNMDKEAQEVFLQMGRAYYYTNKVKEALEFYNKALDLAQKKGLEIKISYPYRLIGSSYYILTDARKAEYFLDKSIEYMTADETLQNKISAYGIRSWNYCLLGELKKAERDAQYVEKFLNKIENPILLTQMYHCCAITYSWVALDYNKAYEYAEKAYNYAKKTGNTVFQYSSLISKLLSLFFQEKYDEAIDIYEQAIKLSNENNISIAIHWFHAFRALIELYKKNINASYKLANEQLKFKKQIQEKSTIIIFLTIKAAYQFVNHKLSEAHHFLEEAFRIFDETDVVQIGCYMLLFKRYVLETMNKDVQVLDKLILKLKKRKGIEIYFNRAKEFVDIIKDLKNKKNRDESYVSTASNIKDKMQLENIVRTGQMLSSVLNIDELLALIMNETLEVTGAERGVLLLYDDSNKNLEYKVIKNIDVNDQTFEVSKNIINNVKKTKKGVVITTADEHDITKSIIEQNIKSIICAPMMIKENLIGLLYLDSKLINNLFEEKDLKLLTVFTSGAAISIENARLHTEMIEKARIEQELEAARDIQLSLLPTIEENDAYEIGAFMKTATEVGGDYYDFYLEDEPYFGVFGDVAGHGLKSGLIMMMAEVAFNMIMRNNMLRNSELRDLYQQINSTLYENIQNRLAVKSKIGMEYETMYMTFKLFRFNKKGEFEIFGVDHVEPIIYRMKSNKIESIESQGRLLGVFKEAILDDKSFKFKLDSEDLLILYSDGIIEAKKFHEEKMKSKYLFGKERLEKIIKINSNKDVNTLIEIIINEVEKWSYRQDDDITICIIKKK